MKLPSYILLGLLFLSFSCQTSNKNQNHKSENLKIEKLSENTFLHVSYLETEDFGKVASNGMIVIDNSEAIVFDTPVNDDVSNELIEWVENNLEAKIKGVVVTHFHTDCLGGLKAFHEKQIPSYANNSTIDLAKLDNKTPPLNGFDKFLDIRVGNKTVLNMHLGEGHTKDNIVSYFPDDQVLFGGCLIKGNKAGKGYLGDANLEQWPITVEKIKVRLQDVQIVIPGHGKPEGKNLLDYTIELFSDR